MRNAPEHPPKCYLKEALFLSLNEIPERVNSSNEINILQQFIIHKVMMSNPADTVEPQMFLFDHALFGLMFQQFFIIVLETFLIYVDSLLVYKLR